MTILEWCFPNCCQYPPKQETGSDARMVQGILESGRLACMVMAWGEARRLQCFVKVVGDACLHLERVGLRTAHSLATLYLFDFRNESVFCLINGGNSLCMLHLFIWGKVCTSVIQCAPVEEVRKLLCELAMSHGSQGRDSEQQPWWQVPSLTGPSCPPEGKFFSLLGLTTSCQASPCCHMMLNFFS